ncbi:Tn3 family transposase, partial [Klebsiella pneumoniae]
PALTRHRLNWTKANYLRAETITSANARLVDFQATLPLAQIWGVIQCAVKPRPSGRGYKARFSD